MHTVVMDDNSGYCIIPIGVKMNELEPSKNPMILGTQYFFALLREDEETIHAVAQQVDELSKKDVFDFINCGLDHTESKGDYLLSRYSGKSYYWIEDSVNHAQSGKTIGLKSVIMDHDYNREWKGLRVKNWKDFYLLIKNDTTY